MSRSGYNDDGDDNWGMICWRGAVTSAIKGKRGQAFLTELRDTLDAMPEKSLIAHSLERETDGAVCAIGAVGRARGIIMDDINPEEWDTVASKFGISNALVREIVYENDEADYWGNWTPEKRWQHMRAWVERHIKTEPQS